MKRFIFLLFIIYSLLNAVPALAAKLELVSPISEIGVGQEFQVDLMLDAQEQDINASEGKVIFPDNLLELKAIYTGSSIINFWIEQPAQRNNEIKFSGVVPGGFSGVLSPYYKGGKPGKVFSLIFSAKSEGSGAIEIRDGKVLLNDGQGTPARTTIFNFQFSIFLPAGDLPKGDKLQIPRDTDPPELFTPEVASDPNIFDNQWFLVFAAQDKGSGVAYYAIHESPRKKDATRIDTKDWIVAESPYVLKDQKLRSYIYVKAVDKAGNERFVVLLSRFAPWYRKPFVDIIGGLIVLIVLLLIGRWLWIRLKSRN